MAAGKSHGAPVPTAVTTNLPPDPLIAFGFTALRIGNVFLSHPFDYARTLIQIGHEPLPPYFGRALFGRPAIFLPNIFQYIAYIKEREGFLGLYSGVKPKLISVIICFSASHQASLKLNPKSARQAEDINALAVSTCKEVTIRSFGIILSHPFQVVAVRMMAQFVGGEKKYRGLFDSLFEVYHTNGILGFFSGLIPRLLGEALTIMIANVLIHCIKTWSRPSQTFQYIPPIINMMVQAYMYPFHVVSNCMVVSSSGLVAGRPPLMPSYKSWLDCWDHLKGQRQLSRGSNVLFRRFLGPSSYLVPGSDSVNQRYPLQKDM